MRANLTIPIAGGVFYIVVCRVVIADTEGFKRRFVHLVMMIHNSDPDAQPKANALAKFLTDGNYFDAPCTVEAYPAPTRKMEDLYDQISNANGTKPVHFVIPVT